MAYININNLNFKYALSETKALDNINFSLNMGDKLLLIGKKGSSKSTLLQMLKESTKPMGTLTGDIETTIAQEDIAFVPQNISATFLSKSVVSNIVFSAENLGLPVEEIEKRLSEVCIYLNISNLLDKNVDDLSGGEKHLVAIASAIITYPKVLLLDEPLSELSVNYRKKIIDILTLLNEEVNMTIVLCEHHINDCISFCNKIGVLEDGRLTHFDNPSTVFKSLFEADKDNLFIPDITKLSLLFNKEIIYTPSEFKHIFTTKLEIKEKHFAEEIISIKNLTYFYSKNNTILQDLNLKIYKGEKLAILGENGTGKTTLLKLLAKAYKPFDGSIKTLYDKVAYLPQDIHSYFTKLTVYEELKKHTDSPENEELVKSFGLSDKLQASPFDLSSGEALLVCLCSTLLKKCDILILDEPTKNLDAFSKKIFGEFLLNSNITVVMSTHDLDFCANYVDNCAFLFNKKVSYKKNAKQFMLDNNLFTTQIKKATKHLTTYDEAKELWD